MSKVAKSSSLMYKNQEDSGLNAKRGLQNKSPKKSYVCFYIVYMYLHLASMWLPFLVSLLFGIFQTHWQKMLKNCFGFVLQINVSSER